MAASQSSAAILETRNVRKTFGGVTALDGVSFELLPGEVHAVCGENGAGKSTLIKVLSGIHPHKSYEGEVRIDGRRAELRGPRDAEAAGLAVIYQELALVPEMTVAENLYLGREPRRFGLVDWDRVFSDAARLLAELEMDIDPAAKVIDLGVGRQQMVEIAKAIGKRTRILILDEPSAALTEQEVEVLLGIVKGLRARGMGCIYISHKLEEVFAVADRITVLRDGRTVVTRAAADLDAAELIRHMVGREITELFPRREAHVGDVLLSVAGLSVADVETGRRALHDISFEVRAGEVLGLGGLMGAGRTELVSHLFGAWGRREHGRVVLRPRVGEPVELAGHGPAEAIALGLVLVSEDRKRYGLFQEQSIGYNLSLSSLRRFQRFGVLAEEREVVENQERFTALRIKAPGLETPVASLSGGNQQKVVLGKALMTHPQVILLDEPTRGIDVGAKLEVYELVNQLTAAGKAVVLVSSELLELLGLSDRIVMLREGRASVPIPRAEATPERLLAAALGEAHDG